MHFLDTMKLRFFFSERLGQTSAMKPRDIGPESLQENMVIEM